MRGESVPDNAADVYYIFIFYKISCTQRVFVLFLFQVLFFRNFQNRRGRTAPLASGRYTSNAAQIPESGYRWKIAVLIFRRRRRVLA